MKLTIATSNPGKLRDFAAAASQHVLIHSLPNIKEIPAPDEDQPTFEGNARLKAIYYSLHAPGEIVIADDSGLEVDALHGAPGVRSARYADDHNFSGPDSATTDERNNLYLLQTFGKLTNPQSQARYRCVLAAARDGKVLCIGEGVIEGEILTASRGTKGFGYDPFFYLPDRDKTMAELDAQTRLSFSHRGRAFAALLEALLLQIPLRFQYGTT
jgi:XTP/dITP diphosphohydrolase